MSPDFVLALPKEAAVLSELRRLVWLTTYRGIYPDELLDNYDFNAHLEKDLARILSEDFDVYFIEENSAKIGYLILQKTDPLYVQSLYLLADFRGKGFGRKAFEFIRSFCRRQGVKSFYLGCHPENKNALGFYEKMGGKITKRDLGHENNRENSLKIEFEA